MSKSYKFIDHTADIAAEISGSSLEELFAAGAEALLHSSVDEIQFEDDDILEFDLSASSKEELLITFLNELNYLLITNKWLYSSIQSIKIFNDTEVCELSAELKGTKLNKDIQIKQEIKSVTYHQVEIVEAEGNYSTLVVFDI
ncbi:MAG: archease [Ignavibacteriaceae bacterium]|jgi:SHS2 domain-containing protein|nr:archease [Ignavibacteriaceae bacterium]